MTKRLTALFVKSKKLAAGMYCDGGGLYLNVRDSGSRSWIFRYREPGTSKQRDLGLGTAGQEGVNLEYARERASHPAGQATIDDWLAEMVDAAGSRRHITFARIAIRIADKVEEELEWQAQDLEMEIATTNIVTPAKENRNFEIRRDPVGE